MTAQWTSPNNDVAAQFLRSSFKPINLFTTKARLGQRDGLRRDEIGGDWRFPGTVRRRLGRHCYSSGSLMGAGSFFLPLSSFSFFSSSLSWFFVCGPFSWFA